jgi:hypothetical protein
MLSAYSREHDSISTGVPNDSDDMYIIILDGSVLQALEKF